MELFTSLDVILSKVGKIDALLTFLGLAQRQAQD
jgi:quinol monooxygenase YgiN